MRLLVNGLLLVLSFAAKITRTEGEWTRGVWLNDDGTSVVTNIGSTAFNSHFSFCPVVQYTRNGEVTAVYVRTSPIPSEFNAFAIFTDTWASKDNELNTDFKIYNSLEDAKRDVGAWTVCNYDDADVGFPRDCGQNEMVTWRWFSMPGGRVGSPGIVSGIGFDVYTGSTCHVPTSLAIPFLQHNINVAEKCCFIIRSPGNAGNDTFILTNAFNKKCPAECAYTRYKNLYVESTELETCLEDIPSPSCCSYDTGALCTEYGESDENNIKQSGTCSEVCKEIADCTRDSRDDDWCKSNQIQKDSQTSPNRSLVSLKDTGVDGKWTLIFRQTLPYLYKKNEFTKEENNPNAANFARLEDLENFRGSDQRFTLKLRWPGLNKENIWSQTSNPVTKKTRGVDNYKAIKIASTGYQWGGLEYNNAQALLDGSVNHGNWWYAVGSISSFSGGIPGPCIVEQKVELWVKTSEFSPAFLLSSDASRLLIDIGENAFNAVFKKCPVVRGLRSVYVRISPLPDSFNAFNIFTGTWSSTNNLINEDFKLYNNIEDATNDVNAWTYCNYNDPGVGFPRDCGQNGVIGNCQFFSMPGNNYEGCIAKNNFKNNGLQIIEGSDCPFTTTTLSDRPVPVKQTAQEYPFALTPPEESGRKKRSAFSRCNGCWNAWIYTCYNAYSYCVYHKQTNWYKLPQMSKWYEFKHECCSKMQWHCRIGTWSYTCPAR